MKSLIVIADQVGGKDTALKRALQIQAKNAVKITLLGFAYAEVQDKRDLEDAGITLEEMKAAALQRRHNELEKVLEKSKASAADVLCEVIWSKDVAGEAISYSLASHGDMIIKSGHRSEMWLHTSTDWQLFRESPVPVMITAGKSWRKKSRVLASVDLTSTVKVKQKLNDKIIAHAKSMAAMLGDEVHLGHAITVPQALVDLDVVNPKKYFAEKKKKLVPVIEKFCENHNLDPANVHLKLGPPDKVIPSIANATKADLVVAGTIGRKGVKGKLIGNTAEGILSKLHTDILAVRP